MRRTIKHKALRCIDEIYPDDNLPNIGNFPLDDFLDEAGRRVVRAVPIHALGHGSDMSGAAVFPRPDGSGLVELPANFIRLIVFRMYGWERPVTMPIRTENPQYQKQFNRITRGGTAKPVAALVNGDTMLEYFSLPEDHPHIISEARYYGFSCIDTNYPHTLIDITAWQLAGLVLSTINDMNGANNCQNKVNEYIALL